MLGSQIGRAVTGWCRGEVLQGLVAFVAGAVAAALVVALVRSVAGTVTTATLGAIVIATAGSLALNGAIAETIAGAIAGAVAKTTTDAITITIAMAIAMTGAMTRGITGSIVSAVIIALAVVVVVAVIQGTSQRCKQLLGMWAGGLGGIVGVASALGWLANQHAANELVTLLLLFFLVLPLANGLFDWLSWWATRALGRRLLGVLEPAGSVDRRSEYFSLGTQPSLVARLGRDLTRPLIPIILINHLTYFCRAFSNARILF